MGSTYPAGTCSSVNAVRALAKRLNYTLPKANEASLKRIACNLHVMLKDCEARVEQIRAKRVKEAEAKAKANEAK